jgi:phage tail-like protein
MKALQKNDDVVVYIQSLLNEGFSLPYYNIAHLLKTYNYAIADILFIKPTKKQPRLTIHSIKEAEEGVNLSVYEESWCNYLPLVLKNDTLEEFLYGFQLLMFKHIEVIDNVENLFTPEKTPEAFVEWLASWFNIAFSDKIKLKNRRKVIYRLTELYNAKGTKYYLKEMVMLLTDIEIDIKERELLDTFSSSNNKNLSFVVSIMKEPPYTDNVEKNLMHQIVKNIIDSEKPIFTTALFDNSFELNTLQSIRSKPEKKEHNIHQEPIIKEQEISYKENEEKQKEDDSDKKTGYDDFF